MSIVAAEDTPSDFIGGALRGVVSKDGVGGVSEVEFEL